MFSSRQMGLETLLAEARAVWARQAQFAQQQTGLLKYMGFLVYLMAFGLLAMTLDAKAERSVAVMGLPALALAAVAYRLRNARRQLLLVNCALHPANFSLPQLSTRILLQRARPVWLQLGLRIAVHVARVDELLARVRSIDLLADFRPPQIAHIARAVTSWLAGLLPAFVAGLAKLHTAAFNPVLSASRPATRFTPRPITVLLC